ncbi:MAG: PEGA domain-containing protein, partial [Archangium sp.]
VVRPQGSSETWSGEVTAGREVLVEASAPGFKPMQQRLHPPAGDRPMDVRLELESDSFEVDVRTFPSGATIVAGGEEWGETPARVRLPASVKQVRLALRCHEGVEVDVAPGARVRKRLKKQRGCR